MSDKTEQMIWAVWDGNNDYDLDIHVETWTFYSNMGVGLNWRAGELRLQYHDVPGLFGHTKRKRWYRGFDSYHLVVTNWTDENTARTAIIARKNELET